MKSFFDKLTQYAILRTVIDVAIGLLMLIFPEQVMSAIIYLIAVYVAVMGVVGIIRYIRNRADGSMYDLVTGILMIILAAMMVVFTKSLISVLPIFLGAILIIAGVFQLAQGISVKRTVGKVNIVQIVLGVLVIAGGILGLANPFKSAVLLFRVFAITILIMGINELVMYFFARKGDSVSVEISDE